MTDLDRVIAAVSDVRAIEYCVLGPLEVRLGGSPATLGGRKQRGVLAVLIAAAGRPVSVDSLLLATYGDDASAGSKATLHTYVSNLRRVIGDVVIRQGDAYYLDCAPESIDASLFEQACARARAIDDPDRASAALRHALSLWRGHAYADIEVNGRLDGEITRLSEMRLSALESRVDADMRAGRHREIVAELDALNAEYPYRETVRGLHMLALYRCGRQAEALRAYARTRELLVADLGIDPSPELQDLERRILAQDRELVISVGSTVQRGAVLAADVDDAAWIDPWQREHAYDRRDDNLEAAATSEGGTKLSPRGSAGYVVFSDAISAVRAARLVVNEGIRIAIDVGDFEMREDEPVGPPLARAARLVAIANPGQVLLSAAAHEALASGAQTGWAAESLGRFDVIGLDPGIPIYQLVGRGFGSDFPELRVDRLPPPVPGGVERSVPGYEIRQLIGVGQLGEVHRAYQPPVGREVALRIFGRAMVCHPQFVRRFETASQRISRVEHPHVVPLLDYWREPNRAVMVSRLMTGGTLEARIPIDGFAAAKALEIIQTIGSAVSSAHRHGVVHGRLRPANVMFDAEDNAYVADLGIDEICAGVVTFASSAYDAPERLGGALATPRSDIYSLGVLAQHLLGGTAPPLDRAFEASEGPASAVIARATDADPAFRQQSVDELIEELRGAFSVSASEKTPFVETRNPYRGLEAFERADSDDFFGRARSVAEMITVLQNEPLLVVVGPSGIGKSSAVKAGLLPALSQGSIPLSDSWLVSEMIPGRAPFENLAAALGRIATAEVPDVVGSLLSGSRSLGAVVDELAPGSPGTLIVVDQLEELFTQTIDDTERRAFLNMIVDVAHASDSTVRLVATLRADYFDRPLGYPGVDDALQGRTVALGALSSEELADAVRLPASAVDVHIESGVVDRIVTEAELQPGALPLMQHSMSELFAGRTTNTITVADLDAIGGVAGAIGRRAEQIFESLDGRCQAVTEQLFLRLVSVTEDHGDTRRRVRRSELEQAGIAVEDLDVVLAEYGRHRLLTFDRDQASRTPTVEVAHEALLTDWDRFAKWVDEARQDLMARRRVESATIEWVTSGADDSFLYSGGRLELAEAWAAESRFGPSGDEQRFLTASRKKVDRDRAAQGRRRRRVIVVLAAAAVLAMLMAAIVFVQRRNADLQADATRARELAGLATIAVDEDPQRAILLGLAAEQRTNDAPDETLIALHRAAQSARLVDEIGGVLSPDSSMDLSRDGSTIAVDHADRNGFTLIDRETGTIVRDVATEEIEYGGLAFDPSGSRLAVVHHAATPSVPLVELFDVASGRSVGALGGTNFACCSAQFDPTGHWFGALQPGSGAIVWDVAAGGSPMTFGPGYDFEFGSDGQTIIVADGLKLRIYDIASGEQVRDIDVPVEGGDIETDHAGRFVDVWSPARVDVLDVATGELRKTLTLPDPSWVQFSDDGTRLSIAASDSLIRIFDTANWELLAQLVGNAGPSSWLFFTPDNSQLVSGTSGTARVWDLSPVGPAVLGNFHVAGGSIDRIVVSADESVAYATAYPEGGQVTTLHRIDLQSGQDVDVLGDVRHYFSNRPLVSPDLSVVASFDDIFVTHLIDLPSGGSTQLKPCQSVRAFDRDGRVAAIDAHLACEEFGKTAQGASGIVDLETGDTLVDLGYAVAVYAAAFGPIDADGLPNIAVVGERDSNDVTLYDLRTGEAKGTFVADAWPVSLAMSADGKRLALLLQTGHLIVLDLDRFVEGRDQSGAIIKDRVAHAAGSHTVAFSDKGLIATGSSLDGVRIWSPELKLLTSVPTHQSDEPSFTFAAGTNTLYYEDGDGIVRRLPIDLDEVTRLARSVLKRGFTPQECDQYFPGEECPTFD